MRLAEFPSGQTAFIDTNCLVYHFLGTHPACTAIAHRAEIGDVHVVTSATVVGELRHHLMILEASKRFQCSPRKALDALRRHPDHIRATMRAHHLTHLASNDTDFARVPGITLWRP